MAELVKQTREAFNSGQTRDLKWRKKQLRAIVRMLDEQMDAICQALQSDLRKPKMEAMTTEIHMARNEAVMMLNNLDKWSKPQPQKKNLLTMMDGVEIRPEPYGVVLVIGAWNYPIQLTVIPMIGAIGAGNCVVIKPSEVSPASAQLLEKIVPQYLDNRCVRIVNGGVPETTALLAERFDYIFYTGNSMVGKIVYQAAAKYLTPVTLELGGKSPCYVDNTSDATIAARRIFWGRFSNCGQTCIAPDYVLCQPGIRDKLVAEMKKAAKEFYGDNPLESKSYGKIVNERHFQRVKRLLSGGRIAIGGQFDEARQLIAPTVLVDVKPTDPAMQEEVFGPVLPVMTVADEEEAISFINSNEKPLALYIFSKSSAVVEKILGRVSSGGVTVNDTLMHVSVPTLPFGGVGNSGMGGYHGKFSFETFSHMRGCMIRKQGMEMVNNLRYPPYTDQKLNFIKFALMQKEKKSGIMSYFPFVMMGVVIAFILKMVTSPARALKQ